MMKTALKCYAVDGASYAAYDLDDKVYYEWVKVCLQYALDWFCGGNERKGFTKKAKTMFNVAKVS